MFFNSSLSVWVYIYVCIHDFQNNKSQLMGDLKQYNIQLVKYYSIEISDHCYLSKIKHKTLNYMFTFPTTDQSNIFQALGYPCIAKCIPFLMLHLQTPMFSQILQINCLECFVREYRKYQEDPFFQFLFVQWQKRGWGEGSQRIG